MKKLTLILLLILLPPAAARSWTQKPAATTTQARDLDLAEVKITSPDQIPRGYALVIGIANYKNLDESLQLQFPESDADAMFRVLTSKENGAFPSENVHFLKGEQATIANIRHEIEEWLPSVAQPSDRVVVYFAGHGFVSGSQGYLAAWDLDLQDIAKTAYPMSSLGDVLANRVKARWKVLLTDACHSGKIPGKITAETTNQNVDSELKRLQGNFLALMATRGDESSYEDPNLSTGFGFFTYFLVQAFEGQADNDPCDGIITADELVEYVRTNVKSYARKNNRSQSPYSWGNSDPDMPLGVNLHCVGTPAADSPSLVGTAVIQVDKDDVDVYVDGKFVKRLSTAQGLTIPGLSRGTHTLEGVKEGYERDTQDMVIVPGQEITFTLHIRYPKNIKKSSLELDSEGLKRLSSQRSTVSLRFIVPGSQSTSDLKSARNLFTQALAEDKNNSDAAFHLGQVNQLLDNSNGSVSAYKQSLEADPSHRDARKQYAAVLIERGDSDEAIRVLNDGIRLDPQNDEAFLYLAIAYANKNVWDRSLEMANKAIDIKASNAQAYLWKADALRQMGVAEKNMDRRTELYEEARENYHTFLDLTNYSTSAADWIAYHFIGFGLGGRHHADRQVSYANLRNAGFLGMCLSEQYLRNLTKAREYCKQAIKYDTKDATGYFVLGTVYRDFFNQANRCDYIVSAKESFSKVIQLNSALDEAKMAKLVLDDIQAQSGDLKKIGCRL